ncbi:unnamed protein product [Rotaria socialis]|uniref:Uncharacterized protein n=1 Tax=Rotaria socialis TaxID=392032 RepID=A0A817VY46_9BILA|nr:unnamed protein product [Rotaria socialis]
MNQYLMDSLPNLKCFSLKCYYEIKQYDSKILPLIRRMPKLEELTLNIMIENRTKFVEGIQINNQSLAYMPQICKFTFYISSKIEQHHLVSYLSNEDIHKTFNNIGYVQVACILNNSYSGATCHMFSLPFAFDSLRLIGKKFTPIVFSHVINLEVHDIASIKHDFFLRVARFFPLFKPFHIINFTSQSHISNDYQLDSIVEYPYLISLHLGKSHIDYMEQFLNETKTRLPRLTELMIDYDQLTIVTGRTGRNTRSTRTRTRG